MNRAESLATLTAWAAVLRSGGRPYFLSTNPSGWPFMNAARSHGLAAVRAIRARNGICGPRYGAAYLDTASRDAEAISESRLAFRAALSAVGIKGAL